jgi:glycosyltransferase involved in cell wall biosynthesis
MCVYNGGRFLQAQLKSIALQSEVPACMAIVDDGSTDGSWELLQRWAPTAPFVVKLYRNPSNLGFVRNFERAVALLDQDVVFLADQDDIWNPDKLATFVDHFAADPQLGLLHSDAELIDGEGRLLHRKLFDALLVTTDERADVAAGRAYRVYAKRNLVTGAACAFRRELLQQALPFSPHWVHDEWLAFTAALVSKVVLLNESTMSYRLHGNNTVGLPIPTLAWRLRTIARAFWQPASLHQRARERRLKEMHAHATRLGAPTIVLDHLVTAAEHANFRGNLPPNRLARLRHILAENHAGHYRAWSNGEISMLHDFLLGN